MRNIEEVENLKYFILQNYLYDSKLPPIFRTKKLSENLIKFNLINDLSKDKFKPVKISIPKKNSRERRVISIPHPLNYLELSKFIIDNWEKIEERLRFSDISISKIQNISSEKNQVRLISKKEKFDEKIIRFSARNKILLKTDISKFYSSIYTHSIAWAIHDKDQFKEIMRNKKINNNDYWGHKLDSLIIGISEKQTKGILTGPFTSEIISEIILSQIDFELKSKFKEIEGFRYVDDYYLFFKNKDEAEIVLSLLREILYKYELELNYDKTKILDIPVELDDSWKFEINQMDIIDFSEKQSIQIKNYFEKLFKLAKKFPEDSVLKYGILKINEKRISKENWYLVESYLLQSINLDSRTLPEIITYLLNKFYSRYVEINLENISRTLNNNLNEYISNNFTSEIIWTLFVFYNFKIRIKEEYSLKLIKNENPIILIMLLYLEKENLTKINKEDIMLNKNPSDDWLLFNEVWNNESLKISTKYKPENSFSKFMKKYKINLIDMDYLKNQIEKELLDEDIEEIDIGEIITPTKHNYEP